MLQSNPLIEWRPSTNVKNIEKSGSGWAIQTDQESLSAEILVLANANNAMKFLDLPLRPIWGQVFWADHSTPAVTVSGECTVARTDEGYLSVGSTYDRENLDLEVRPEENKKLVEEAKRVLGISIDENSIISARTGLRATTPKKIPMIGRVDENLYVNVGFGSRGFVFAPLAAEILTYFIDGGIPPIENHLLEEIESQRIRCKISSSASISLRQ